MPPDLPKATRASVVLQKNWTELIKPNKLDIQPGCRSMISALAKVVAEPLERGFRPDPRQRAAADPAVLAAGRGGDLASRSTAFCTSSRRSPACART